MRLWKLENSRFRLSEREYRALIHAIHDIDGKVFLFGSRLDPDARGGDIDILVLPRMESSSSIRMAIDIEREFWKQCEQKLDVVIWDDTPFCRSILKKARLIYERNH